MNKIKLVVFDMAGTTIQDKKEVEKCFALACEQTGLAVSEERILALQGYSKIQVFRMLWDEKLGENHPDYPYRVQNSYDIFRGILENHYYTHPVLPTEGCLETFEFLRKNNVKIALTTGFYRKVIDIIIGKVGWLEGLDANYLNTSGKGIIDASIASDEVPQGRPQPFMIQRAMQLLGVTNPKEVINIGDTPSDLESGFRANCLLSLGLTNGTHSYDQLVIHPHDALLGSMFELKNIIEEIEHSYEKV